MTEREQPCLVPLATMTLSVREPVVFEPTPSGSRWIVEVERGELVGARLDAEISGHANADWFVLGPGRVGTVDARLLIQTRDGAAVLVQYHGRVDLSTGSAPIYIAPRFETADERYTWLNTIQAVGRGSFVNARTLVYDLLAVQ